MVWGPVSPTNIVVYRRYTSRQRWTLRVRVDVSKTMSEASGVKINERMRARARRWRRLRDAFPSVPRRLLRQETLFLLAALVLGVMAAISSYASRATTLTVGVAAVDGSEPQVIAAFAEASEHAHSDVRLRLEHYDSVADSARALQAGRVDLAVVRPDVLLPTDSSILANLRDRALIVVAPDGAPVTAASDLAGRHLGLILRTPADLNVLRQVLAEHSLSLSHVAPTGSRLVAGVILHPADVRMALANHQVNAIATLAFANDDTTISLVRQVQAASPKGKVNFVAMSESDALIARHPGFKPITLPEGSFGGDPALPTKEVKTVGSSVLLMVRTTLDRGTVAAIAQQLFTLRPAYARQVPAANAMRPPEFDNPTAATTARIPIHPGAIDYYNREQRGFFEKYGDLMYLFALLLSGLGSGVAWLRGRLKRERREHVDEVLERLASIVGEAHDAPDTATCMGLVEEIDRMAVEVVAELRDRGADSSTLIAVDIALDAARSSVGVVSRLPLHVATVGQIHAEPVTAK